MLTNSKQYVRVQETLLTHELDTTTQQHRQKNHPGQNVSRTWQGTRRGYALLCMQKYLVNKHAPCNNRNTAVFSRTCSPFLIQKQVDNHYSCSLSLAKIQAPATLNYMLYNFTSVNKKIEHVSCPTLPPPPPPLPWQQTPPDYAQNPWTEDTQIPSSTNEHDKNEHEKFSLCTAHIISTYTGIYTPPVLRQNDAGRSRAASN